MFDVITIGTATRDTFVTSGSYKILKDKSALKKLKFDSGQAICFELGSKIEINPPILTTGGGASNAAVTFSRMGLNTGAFVKIGNDRPGEAILNEFKHEKITSFAVVDKEIPTAYSVILLSQNGERTILVYRGAAEKMSFREIPLNKMRSKWAYIVPGTMQFSSLKDTVNYLSDHNTAIAINPSKALIKLGLKKISPILKKIDVLILNREEAAYLTEVNYKKRDEIFKKLDKVFNGILVITDGNNGSLISDNSYIYSAGVIKDKNVIDRTGAGDAFGSAFVSAIIRKNIDIKNPDPESIKYAIKLATANSTSVIENIGAKSGILNLESFEANPKWQKLKIETKELN